MGKTDIPTLLQTERTNGRDGGRGSHEGCHDEPGVSHEGHGQRVHGNQRAQRREKRITKRLGGKTRRARGRVDLAKEVAEENR